jgi:DNA-binding response OmpR family regulator
MDQQLYVASLCRPLASPANLPPRDTVDRIVGYEVGADDYMVKPFDLRELLARVKSLLRRVAATPVPSAPSNTGRVTFGRFNLDLDNRWLADGDGVDIPLTAMEFDLIATFVRHPNQVLSRDQLLELSTAVPDHSVRK